MAKKTIEDRIKELDTKKKKLEKQAEIRKLRDELKKLK